VVQNSEKPFQFLSKEASAVKQVSVAKQLRCAQGQFSNANPAKQRQS